MAQFNKDLQVNDMTIQNDVGYQDGQLVIYFRDQEGNIIPDETLKVKSVKKNFTTDIPGVDLSDNVFNVSEDDGVFITGKAAKDYIAYLIQNDRKY